MINFFTMGRAMTNEPMDFPYPTPSASSKYATDREAPEVPEPLTYGLMKLALSQGRFVPIQKEAFDKITAARDCLMQLLVIEEKFDFVVENLAALERAVHDAAELCKLAPITTVEFQINKSDINRHVANLVALGRMFTEQSLVHVDKLNALAGVALFDLAAARTRQYDARLGYRLFEELRNFNLHRGAAVHYADYHSFKVVSSTCKLIRGGVPMSFVKQLRVVRGNKVSRLASWRTSRRSAAWRERSVLGYGVCLG